MIRYRAEDRIQSAVCLHLRWRGVPGVVWFAVPNGGYRTAAEAHVLKATGVRAGASDLILLHAGKAFALELKTDKGRATNAQIQFIDDWRAAGGEAYLAHGLNEALAVLEEWGLLRRNASNRAPEALELTGLIRCRG
jgi:hypothetical protein